MCNQVATVVGVITSLIAAGLFTLLVVHCRSKRSAARGGECSLRHTSATTAKIKDTDKQIMYSAGSKMNNLDRELVSNIGILFKLSYFISYYFTILREQRIIKRHPSVNYLCVIRTVMVVPDSCNQ